MSGKFIDTNVLVYAYTSGDTVKHETARSLLQDSSVDYIISTQVLGEFYNTLTKYKVAHDVITSMIDEITAFCDVKSVELKTVQNALSLKKRYGFSYWDSLILSAALENGCEQVLSEDMHDGQVIEKTLMIKDIFK